MNPELKDAAHQALHTETWSPMHAAAMAYADQVRRGIDNIEARRALADAACEYAGKRVERHVAAEREAIAQMLEKSAGIADMAGGMASTKHHRLWEAADAIRARGNVVPAKPHMSPPPQTTAAVENKSAASRNPMHSRSCDCLECEPQPEQRR